MARAYHQEGNRLVNEKSPYLRQHAMNPVEWYPWASDAFERAKKEDKPVIISIGYSSCHWCHVMERESFEDMETARIMNENFINIKVDREERPELDSLYLKAVQAMTGHAGWPLTVITTPDGVPFYGGSYFPPDDRYGLPSFKKVLLAASLAYKKNKKRIDSITSDIEQVLKKHAVISPIELKSDISDIAFDAARLFFDPVWGGFGRGTKFPHSMFLKFLLKYSARTEQPEAVSIVKKTLRAMANGGIYDHLGGGFHRYSVDEKWDIPHFEKMLYDNALLAGLYAYAYAATGEDAFRETAQDTIDYLLREMRSSEGGFYSAQDADVEGSEGAYYLWREDEIRTVLGPQADRFIEQYTITKEGNYDGLNTLRRNILAEPVPAQELNQMREKLLGARLRRKAPDIDRKIITAWNGLAISALAYSGRALKRPDFIEEARKAARFILSSAIDDDGRLLRYYLEGKAGIKANLEDYALLGVGLVDLYESTHEYEWLEEARKLAEEMAGLFYDEAEGLFYDTGRDQEKLFVRERDLFDNDLPSGNSAAADLLLRLSRKFENKGYRELSEGVIRSAEGIREEPLLFGNFLCVLESFLNEKYSGRAH